MATLEDSRPTRGFPIHASTPDAGRSGRTRALRLSGSWINAQPVAEEVLIQLRSPGIHWVEWVPSVDELMRTWDAMLFPSIREGMPNVVIEAAASGLPVVGYRTTGVCDAVENGVTGRLVDLGDTDALAAALVDVLAVDSNAMKSAAREFAVSRFSQTDVTAAFAGFLNRRSEGIRTLRCLEAG